jgi:RimJ/RimL family protein N-acetyltransferase
LPARRLYETSGFAYEGRLRKHVALGGKRFDLFAMGMLRDEFDRLAIFGK